MAKTKIKSRKTQIKSGKTQKKTQENKYFLGALLTIGGLFVIGIAAVILFGNGGKTDGTPAAGSDPRITRIQNEAESKYGAKWRRAGYTNWEYSAVDPPMLFVDQAKWAGLSIIERKKRMNETGKEFSAIIGGDQKQAYIMFHDSVNTNIMIGTYSGAGGAQIQQ
ncbi:MAG: hypothetical protein Q8L35_04515 [Actinomycetota bacterium]|nr:hypothetical protein [Actinomycetota bacterium]